MYRPPSDYWTLSSKPQKCLSQTIHLLIAGIVNTITDFLVVLLSIPPVWGLRLPLRQQITLVFLFGAGFIATFAGCARIVYTYRLTTSYDQTWMKFPVWISSSVELYLGVVGDLNSYYDFSNTKQICASVPPTRKFFSRYNPKLLGSSIIYGSKSTAINRSKNTDITNPNQGGILEMERMAYANPNPQPHEAKKSEVARRMEAVDSSYNFPDLIRVGTADSSTSDGTDGAYNIQRGDSDDELVVG